MITMKSLNRYELKFLVDIREGQQLMDYLISKCSIDYEKYSISSLYFDTYDFKCYLDGKCKSPYRSKFRIRGYNDISLDSLIYMEIKEKVKKVVEKSRLKIPLKDAYKVIYNQDTDLSANQELLAMFKYINKHQFSPKVCINYNRTALSDSTLGIRVTLDSNIRCRSNDLRLEKPILDDGIYLINPTQSILEIKYDEILPIWITKLLENFDTSQKTISKYCKSIEKLNLR